MNADRLPSTLLTREEVIAELRLDSDTGRERSDPKLSAQRRLKYMRATKAIPFIRVGYRSYVYPRQGIERFKKQNLVEAVR